ncbi:ASKHA domain-containing protein, partial [Thermodesulfobacteriota bacterium]
VSVHKIASDPLTLFEPLTQKIYIKLKEPTPEDNISDIDRIERALKKKTNYNSFNISLNCLQGLASKLRKNDWAVTATIAKRGDNWGILQFEPGDTSDQNFGLAIDVGTTTVVAQLIDMKTGNVMGIVGSHNLQAKFGEDVISRMIYACGKENGLDPLHEAVIKNINRLITKLINEKNINPEDITAIVAAGNTTMSHMLLSLIPCSIRMDPYVPTTTRFPQIRAEELKIGINPKGIFETIANVSSYVGGDIVSGVLACGIDNRPEIKALIDVGTNGEIAIGNNDWLVCCSASAGPAFEGGGISSGMRATMGAIERITLKNNEIIYNTIGKAKPRGICGSGLIDLLDTLVRNKIINQDGKFNLSPKHKRVVEKDGEVVFIVAYANETESAKDITISEPDLGNLIRSKGAVFAAVKSLSDYVGLSFDQIETFFVAGGFGSYLDISKAISIGLLPDIAITKFKFVGNSSLMGARMALLSGHAFERTEIISNKMTNIELSTYQPFMDEYVASLFLPHTDKKLFPSVDYWT